MGYILGPITMKMTISQNYQVSVPDGIKCLSRMVLLIYQ